MLELPVRRWMGLAALWGVGNLAFAQAFDPSAVSEKDFLTDMPIVLSVSRLPQRLDETPGAVTVLDRDMIRMSGARDVADLLRLVPGFQTSTSFETAAPLASYHGGFDAYSNRIQVLVDGRSAYSSYFIGSVGPGLQTVSLEDIERIEVLRGSNSAAYGARAMLAVINIITRHTADTLGSQASLKAGENGIRDSQARIGWGNDEASFRLTVERRADDGLTGSNGHNRVDRANFRADLHPSAVDEIQLRAGTQVIDSGKGRGGDIDDPLRESSFGSSYAQIDWRRSLAADQDIAFSASHMQEYYQDTFPYFLQALSPMFGANDIFTVDGSGHASNDTVSLQHTFRQGSALRVVWGGEFRRERVTSKALYNSESAFITDFTRLFGNAEWRVAPDLVVNAGAMAEQSSISGDSFAPRLMLNWHAAEGQTLRAGVSRAFRPPSTYEKFANLRYVWNGMLLGVNTLASGNVVSERISTKELGYLGDFPQVRASLDVRVFHERLDDFIRQLNATSPKDYANGEGFAIQGIEYQLKWRPWVGATVIFNQAYIDIKSQENALAAPNLASSLSLFQKLPGGLNLSLMHQDSGTVAPQKSNGDPEAMTRTDVRLGIPLRVGRNRGELAFVVQNTGTPYRDFVKFFSFERRAFVTLQIEN